MKFGDGVPRWARRRVERHLARHGDGKIVRWMSFATGGRHIQPAAGLPEIPGNILPFIRRTRAAEPGQAAPPLDATGS
ncbi:hypothetical protein [Methylobacterium sp. SyP6R]|uniref:hypothetical protein n=1 Tax=Methylobacterium sp. SyP6R TaxID=2718876 RepID=UPI001F17CE63|nr:hypothetical protein [Methylobacterium sp. SyP6R]MCF4126946.1 hypothetical protein [Methylobacterium sp. SyP6R]